MSWREYEPGDTIYDESMKSDILYQVVEGVVEIFVTNSFGDKKISKTYMRGELFGMSESLEENR